MQPQNSHTFLNTLWKTGGKLTQNPLKSCRHTLSALSSGASGPISALDLLGELRNLNINRGIGADLALDGLYRREHGGMIALEELADLRQRHIGELTYHVYRDMSCVGNILGAFRALDVVDRDAVLLSDLFHDPVDCDADGFAAGHEIGDRVLGELDGYRRTGEEAERAELFYRALDLTDIRFEVFGLSAYGPPRAR